MDYIGVVSVNEDLAQRGYDAVHSELHRFQHGWDHQQTQHHQHQISTEQAKNKVRIFKIVHDHDDDSSSYTAAAAVSSNTSSSGDEILNALTIITEEYSSRIGETSPIPGILEGKKGVLILVDHQSLNVNSHLFSTPMPFNRTTNDLFTHLTLFDLWFESVLKAVYSITWPSSGGVAIFNTHSLGLHSIQAFEDLISSSEKQEISLLLNPIKPGMNSSKDCPLGVYHVRTNESNAILDVEFPEENDKDSINSEQHVQRCFWSAMFLGSTIVRILVEESLSSTLLPCTYFGIDEGLNPIHFCFYRDVLSGFSLSKAYPSTSTTISGLNQNAKISMIRTRLHQSLFNNAHATMRACVDYAGLHMSFRYPIDFQRLLHSNELNEFATKQLGLVHLRIQCSIASPDSLVTMFDSSNTIVLNSFLQGDETAMVLDGSIICDSYLSGAFKIGRHSMVSGIHGNIGCNLQVPDNTMIQEFCLNNGKHVLVIQSITNPVRDRFWQRGFLGYTWEDLFGQNMLDPSEVWDDLMQEKSFQTAKVFPVFDPNSSEDISLARNALQYLASLSSSSTEQDYLAEFSKSPSFSWSLSNRISLRDIKSLIDTRKNAFFKKQLCVKIMKEQVVDTLMNRKSNCLRPIFTMLSQRLHDQTIFESLDHLAIQALERKEFDILARTLASIADALVCTIRVGDGQNEGGIRSGPSRNIKFQPFFKMLENEDPRAIIGLANQRKEWLFNSSIPSAHNIIRFARHYEGAAAVLIRKSVLTVDEFIVEDDVKDNKVLQECMSMNDQWYQAESAVRIDIAGGWTDTPPITFERGGVVTNLAILLNGKRPIGARARRLKEPILVLRPLEKAPILNDSGNNNVSAATCTKLQDLFDYCVPSATGALLKSAILCMKLVNLKSEEESLSDQLMKHLGGGIEIESWSDVPQGSGLGTSSILAGCVIAAIDAMRCACFKPELQRYTMSSLVHSVLKVEQMLTSGGGWQDQIGGLMPDAKISSSGIGLPLYIETEQITLSKEFREKLNAHLILAYTGRPRLARNLLQDVIRRWYARLPDILDTTHALVQNAKAAEIAFREGNLEALAKSISLYMEHKKVMASGCLPVNIERVLQFLHENDIILGAELAGAGGGGFMVLVTKEPNAKSRIREVLENPQFKERFELFDCTVDDAGMQIFTT